MRLFQVEGRKSCLLKTIYHFSREKKVFFHLEDYSIAIFLDGFKNVIREVRHGLGAIGKKRAPVNK